MPLLDHFPYKRKIRLRDHSPEICVISGPLHKSNIEPLHQELVCLEGFLKIKLLEFLLSLQSHWQAKQSDTEMFRKRFEEREAYHCHPFPRFSAKVAVGYGFVGCFPVAHQLVDSFCKQFSGAR